MIDRSKSEELRLLEEGYDLYLFLREVYQQAAQSPSRRQAILFPQELAGFIKRSAEEIKQLRQRQLGELQKARRKRLKEEAAAHEEARAVREYIQNLGMPDWDFG